MSERLGFEKYYDVEVAGAIGRIIFDSRPMSDEEAQAFWDRGIPVPLDIMPRSFWWDGDLPRFGEEVQGPEF